MKIRITLYSIIFFLLFIVVGVFSPSVNGVTPQLLLCGVVCLTMFEKEKFGTVFALIFGLLYDFACGEIFGISALLFVAASCVIGFLFSKLLCANLLTCYISTTVLILLYDLMYFSVSILLGRTCDFWASLLKITVPKIFLTLPFIFIIYLAVKAIGTNRNWRRFDEEY